MTVAACLLVTAVVWSISFIRSVRWRALVYSLPIPITTVLLLTPAKVDGAQLLGVLLLNVFFLVVGMLYHRYGWHILLADGAGIAVYVILGALVAALAPWPILPTLAAVAAVWIVAVILLRSPARSARPRASARPAGPALPGQGQTAGHGQTGRDRPGASLTETFTGGLPRLAKLVVVFLGSLLTVGLGSLLNGLVVTFPYSGILVAIESRRDLPEFSRHFARNSIGLVFFLVAYYYAPGNSEGVALACAWSAFLVCALILNLPRLVRRIRRGRRAVARAGPG